MLEGALELLGKAIIGFAPVILAAIVVYAHKK